MSDPDLIETAPPEVQDAPRVPETAPEPAPESDAAAPEPPKLSQTVPHGQFHKELTRRKEAEGRARQLEEENRKLYDTLLNRLEGQRGADPRELPPLDDDPANLRDRLALHERALVELGQQYQHQTRQQDNVHFLRTALGEAREEAPDIAPEEFIAAGNFAFRAREAMFAAYMPPHEASKAAQAEEERFIAECRRLNKNPYIAVREAARSLGFAPATPPVAPAPPPPQKLARAETTGLPKGGKREEAVDLTKPDVYAREYDRFFRDRPNATKGDWYSYCESALKKHFS